MDSEIARLRAEAAEHRRAAAALRGASLFSMQLPAAPTFAGTALKEETPGLPSSRLEAAPARLEFEPLVPLPAHSNAPPTAAIASHTALRSSSTTRACAPVSGMDDRGVAAAARKRLQEERARLGDKDVVERLTEQLQRLRNPLPAEEVLPSVRSNGGARALVPAPGRAVSSTLGPAPPRRSRRPGGSSAARLRELGRRMHLYSDAPTLPGNVQHSSSGFHTYADLSGSGSGSGSGSESGEHTSLIGDAKPSTTAVPSVLWQPPLVSKYLEDMEARVAAARQQRAAVLARGTVTGGPARPWLSAAGLAAGVSSRASSSTLVDSATNSGPCAAAVTDVYHTTSPAEGVASDLQLLYPPRPAAAQAWETALPGMASRVAALLQRKEALAAAQAELKAAEAAALAKQADSMQQDLRTAARGGDAQPSRAPARTASRTSLGASRGSGADVSARGGGDDAVGSGAGGVPVQCVSGRGAASDGTTATTGAHAPAVITASVPARRSSLSSRDSGKAPPGNLQPPPTPPHVRAMAQRSAAARQRREAREQQRVQDEQERASAVAAEEAARVAAIKQARRDKAAAARAAEAAARDEAAAWECARAHYVRTTSCRCFRRWEGVVLYQQRLLQAADTHARVQMLRSCLDVWTVTTCYYVHRRTALASVLYHLLQARVFATWHTLVRRVSALANVGVLVYQHLLLGHFRQWLSVTAHRRAVERQRIAEQHARQAEAAREAHCFETARLHHRRCLLAPVFLVWQACTAELKLENARLRWEQEKLAQVMAWLPPLSA